MNRTCKLVLFSATLVAFANSKSFGQVRREAETFFQRISPSIVLVETDKAQGTGFFFADSQTVATCFHVIDGAKTVQVTLRGSEPIDAISFSFDRATDLALLKLAIKTDRKNLASASFESVHTGDKAIVIGNPLGFLTRTMSDGIVSALRSKGDLRLLQFTAPISEGSSGSPLLNKDGKVIGVVTSTFEQGNQLGLAVAVKHLKALVERPQRPIVELSKSKSVKIEPDPVTIGNLKSSASKEWARYLWAIRKNQLLWEIAFDKTSDEAISSLPSFDGNRRAYGEFIGAVGDIDKLLKIDLADKELTIRASQLKEAAENALQAAQEQIDAELQLWAFMKLKNANEAEFRAKTETYFDSRARVRKCLTEIHRVHIGENWASESDFSASANLAAFFYYFSPRKPVTFYPDPLLPNNCTIARPFGLKSLWKAGDSILGVQIEPSGPFEPVLDWRDVVSLLASVPRARATVSFQVRRNGSIITIEDKLVP